MAFYPHKGDLDSPRKQKKWKGFIKELDKSEVRSGLDSIKVDQKRAVVVHYERIVEVSRYLDTWLEDLRIPGLDKWALVKYLVDRNHGKVLSADSRSKILAWRSIADSSPTAEKAAEMFVEAWNVVFKEEKAHRGEKFPEIDLLDVFQLDQDVLACADSPRPEEDSYEDSRKNSFEVLDSKLGTYSSLGCLICFKHSCEHGFYTDDNLRERFSVDKGSIARRLAARQRRSGHSNGSNGVDASISPCGRKCYLAQNYPDLLGSTRQWTEGERQVLWSICLSMASSQFKSDPICHVAALLDRDCCDVHREHRRLRVAPPEPEVTSPESDDEPPALGWYNRYKKKLSKRHGADKYHKPNWDHIRRDIDNVCALRGCDHDGPCSPENPNCPCARKGQFCEKFCGCSVDECAYKFTGCACRSRGKTCHMDQRGEECICIQLNRECDPDLCGSCGALERADPKNSANDALHSTGCQNCALQRGVAKRLVMGRSQCHGYGLFAAENIRKDSFIIEYMGELVSGDEGDRRYIRRQNLFDGTKALSFNFTLLKECDVWIDGARYGNLSRYINHEEDGGQRCNVVPRIVLVNGGFRIEFRAKRNIKAWEELSFDYGEDFGLDIDKKPRGGKAGRPREAARKNVQRNFPRRRELGEDRGSNTDEASGSEDGALPEDTAPSRKRKRGADDVVSEEDRRPRRANGPNRGEQPTGYQGSGRPRERRAMRKSGTRNNRARTSVTSEDQEPQRVTRAQKGQRLRRAVEIDDSEEEDAGEGGEGEDEGNEEGEGDEDDTTPSKRDQPARTRRQPAKFRDDELYDFKPGS